MIGVELLIRDVDRELAPGDWSSCPVETGRGDMVGRYGAEDWAGLEMHFEPAGTDRLR